MKTCRLLATALVLLIITMALTACATVAVEDQRCRTLTSILDDASYYDVCVQQKAAAK